MEIELNWIAILLAGLSTMVVGSLWYGPLFGKRWEKLAKIKHDPNFNGSKMAVMYTGTFLVALVSAIILAMAAYVAHGFLGGSYLGVSVMTAIALWLGFTATRFYTHDSFEGRPMQLTLLAVMYELVTFIVMALIIGVWPA